MAEQSFGRWKVTDAIGEAIPRKAIVEIRAGDEALTMVLRDGKIVGPWPVDHTRFQPYGTHNGYLDLVGQSAWIKSVDKRPADELAAFLAERWSPEAPATVRPPEPDGPTITRSYAAPSADLASRAFAADTAVLSTRGYRPTAQFWADPDRSTTTALRVGGVIVALASLLVLAVPFVFILLLGFAAALFLASSAYAGQGYLSVTYQRDGGAAPEWGASTADGSGTRPGEAVIDGRRRLIGLAQLRDEGLITADEFDSKRAAVVNDL